MNDQDAEIMGQATTIVAAYLSHNSLRPDDVPALIGAVHAELTRIASGVLRLGDETKAAAPREPAVPIKKSVQHDHIVCLEDGKKFKSLKRHISKLGMTPETYRAKWGLPADYPMACPAYSEKRSALAKNFGLGRKVNGAAA